MGAILGLSGGAVLLLIFAILWMTGVFQPGGNRRPGKAAVTTDLQPADKRTGDIN
jgi:hypothetical protein